MSEIDKLITPETVKLAADRSGDKMNAIITAAELNSKIATILENPANWRESTSGRKLDPNAIKALITTEVEKTLLDFAEYCHERYTGCTQLQPGEWDYGYKSEVAVMAGEYLTLSRYRKGEL